MTGDGDERGEQVEHGAQAPIDFDRLFSMRERDLLDISEFPALPIPIWTHEFFRANEFVNLYTDFQVARILEALDLEAAEPTPVEAERLDARGVPADRRDTVDWLLDKATDSALIEVHGDARRRLPASLGADLRHAVLAEDARLDACLELIDVAASGYVPFLRGETSGEDVLFTSETMSLWERFFSNDNPLYFPTNYLAAEAAHSAFEGGEGDDAAVGPRRLRVLEVGAGCGSGTEALLGRLGASIDSCVLTDISPHFLRTARERIERLEAAGGVDVRFRGLDLDADPGAWRLEPGSVDLVFAVNVLHAVRDLERTLRGLREVLVDGGCLVLGECVRPHRGRPVHPEFVFQLLNSFRSAVVVPQHRTRWGFIEATGWHAMLTDAGFGEVVTVPDYEFMLRGYGEHCIASIVARAGGSAE